MVFLISLVLAWGFILVAGKSLSYGKNGLIQTKLPLPDILRRKVVWYYSAASVLSVFTAAGTLFGWFDRLEEPWLTLAGVLTKGGLAGALFVFVMYAGAFPSGSRPSRKLIPIRGQLSIIAGILSLGHAVRYGATYFVLLFTRASYLKMSTLAASVTSFFLVAVMIPLLATSFLFVRRRMKPKNWKKLQKAAYVFYVLLWAHIVLMNFPSAKNGNLQATLNIHLYSIIFLTYLWLKTRKYLLVYLIAGVYILIALTAFSAPSKSSTGTDLSAAKLQDGEYSGAGMGYNGRLTVSVTIEDGRLCEVKLKGSVDDEPYVSEVKAKLLPAIVEAGSPDVDAVSGATTTSHGVQEAVRDALEKAVPHP